MAGSKSAANAARRVAMSFCCWRAARSSASSSRPLVSPLAIWQALSFDFGAPRALDWGLLAYYAATASVITVWLWMAGLRGLPAAKAGVFMVFLPISTALIGLLLGESLSGAQALAYGLALLGVLLATWPAKARSR